MIFKEWKKLHSSLGYPTLPEFSYWRRIGNLSNGLSLLVTLVGSLILIRLSDSSIDVALNALALLFVLQVDDDCVSIQDYIFTSIILHFYYQQIENGTYPLKGKQIPNYGKFSINFSKMLA